VQSLFLPSLDWRLDFGLGMDFDAMLGGLYHLLDRLFLYPWCMWDNVRARLALFLVSGLDECRAFAILAAGIF
jgi:hypothetical protein